MSCHKNIANPKINTYRQVSHATLTVRDYCGNYIYKNGKLERILTDNGYMQDGELYFYIKDYQGNVRVVLDQRNQPVELNAYYPYGMLIAATPTDSRQPHKYGAKELDRENGLDWYDSQARWYAPQTGRTSTLDPLAEKYPKLSPYLWCAANPIRFIDLDGNDATITINGNNITIYTNIIIYGEYATQNLADQYKKNIMDNWGKMTTYIDGSGKKYHITWSVNVMATKKNLKKSEMDFDGKNNYLKVADPDDKEPSYVKNSNYGKIRSSDIENSNPMSHEFGHLLGLKDRYKGTHTDFSWEFNIMGEPAGKGRVENRNIDQLLENPIKINTLFELGSSLIHWFTGKYFWKKTFNYYTNSKNAQR